MVREFTLGQTEKFTKVSGSKDLKKGKEFGKVFSEIATLVSGVTQKQMATEFTSGKTVTALKVSGRIV